MSKPAIRPWCALAQYPGMKDFVVGTITLPTEARHDEIIAALDSHAREFLPDGFTITRPMCGALIFHEDHS